MSSQLTTPSTPLTSHSTTIQSGFLAQLRSRRSTDAINLSAPPLSALKTTPLKITTKKIGAATEPPFGKGILVSRTPEGRAVVSSVPAANAIYRDVYTSVFNRTQLLPFTLIIHNGQQDAFYFIKEDAWRAQEDRGQLKRLQGQVNTTFHETKDGSGGYLDVKIHGVTSVVNLRYGTTIEKETQRLLHHAKMAAIRKAWHKEKESVRSGFVGMIEWSAQEVDEILKVGYATGYEGEYVHDARVYPELAEDPFNVRFVKKREGGGGGGRKRRDVSCQSWWFQWRMDC